MARKDANGRNLKTGEYYDSKNNRYQFRKMIDGKRITITSDKLADLRKQENELLCRLDKGVVFDNKRAKMTLNEYFDYWFGTYARSGEKLLHARIINHIIIRIFVKLSEKRQLLKSQSWTVRELLMKWWKMEKNTQQC